MLAKEEKKIRFAMNNIFEVNNLLMKKPLIHMRQ